MDTDRTTRLNDLIATLQRRWGQRALRQGAPAAPFDPPAPLPTGYPALDRLLHGGYPRGHAVELLGPSTSGSRTLALVALARAQQQGESAAYLDFHHTFDPDYADRCGVRLGELLLIRPAGALVGLAIARDLLDGGIGLLLCDSLAALNSPEAIAALPRLARALRGQPRTLLLMLTPAPPGQMLGERFAPHATLRLHLARQRWLRCHRDVVGYESRVSLLANRLGLPEGQVIIPVKL